MGGRLVSLLSRLVSFPRRRRLEEESLAEMELHIELLTEENLRRGMTPFEARRQARLRFGATAGLSEILREERGFPVVETCLRDVRHGTRLLRKNPGFAGLVVLALGLGIGLAITAFSIVNATRLRGLPVEEPERILAIGTIDEEGRNRGVSYPEFEAWRDATRGIEEMAAFRRAAFAVSDRGRPPEQVQGLYVSANAFRVLGVRPALGRDFVDEDDRPGAPPVAMLGSGVFQSRYAGAPDVVGRTILVNTVPTLVVGVMPAGFQFDFYADLWLPLPPERHDGPTLQLVGRLGESSLTAARTELQSVASRSEDDVRVHVRPFTGTLSGDPVLLALVTAVALVLLVACANVANLLLARSLRRGREIATRLSLGATRGRIVRQLLAESALLAVLAGALGFALSVLGVRLFANGVAGIAKPYWIHWEMDGRVYAFAAILCVATAVLFSLAPALLAAKGHATRTSTAGASSSRFMGALLVTQVALTLGLVTGAGLLTKSFFHLYRLDRVVDTSELTTLSLRLPEAKYPTPELRAVFYQRLEERLEGVGNVTASTIASAFPFAGAESRAIEIEGSDEASYEASFVAIGSRYFEALGVSLLRGRAVDETEAGAVVNELFASLHFPGRDPIGRRIRVSGDAAPSDWLTIVGIAPTIRQRTLAEPDPTIYVPYRSTPMPIARLLVRSESDPDALVTALREEVRALDPDLPLYGIMAMDELLSQSRWPNRVYGVLFAAFAAVALSLSIVGLYGMTAVSVAQRVREIGVRLAFGAGARQVVWAVARRIAIQVGAGLILGTFAALGLGRTLQSFLVDTSPYDSATLITTVVLLAVTAATACFLPTWRATRLDPLSVLRHE